MHSNESEWIERFASHLKHERRMSAHTVAAYLADIAQLAVFCEARKIACFSDIDSLQVRTFAATSHARGLSARSIQRRLSALRTFFEFLMREGASMRNPAVDVRAPKQKKRLPTTLDADQMGRLLAFRTDDTLSARDKAIMELFYSSGLRLTELVTLDVASLDLKDRTVRVLGKGSEIAGPADRPLCHCGARALARGAGRAAREGPRGSAGAGVRRPRRPATVGARGAVARRRCGRAGRVSACTFIPTCSATPSRRTCSSRAAICAAFRSCSATPTSAPLRSTPTWISSTWPRSTMPPIRGPAVAAPGVATLERRAVRPQ